MKENKRKTDFDFEDMDISQSQSFNQLGIFVLDGSQSMTEQKDGNLTLGANVNHAIREFFSYFQNNSTIKENISIAIIMFGSDCEIHTPITRLVDINDDDDYNPLGDEHRGRTDIGKALDQAGIFAKQHMESADAENIPHSVTIIVLSDGICDNPKNTLTVADKIKNEFNLSELNICTTYFSNPSWTKDEQAAKDLLLKIASSENHYKTTYKPEDLRKFFISSMSASSTLSDEKLDY